MGNCRLQTFAVEQMCTPTASVCPAGLLIKQADWLIHFYFRMSGVPGDTWPGLFCVR